MTEQVKLLFADTTINSGGLMRCEMETIQDYIGEHMSEHIPSEPLVIACKHCSGRPLNIILEGGVWRWKLIHVEE